MKFRKLGKLFNPFDFQELSSFSGYAQSPQAVVFDDKIRIYFSIRKLDHQKKFVSHILFVDFDKSLKKILNLCTQPVITKGSLGAFDEHGIFPFSPLRVNGRFLAYTCGWSRRFSVPVETSIGLAESLDGGVTFTRLGEGPIMSSSLHEPFLVGDAFVRFYQGKYHMWYIFGTKWLACNSQEPERVYKIAYAVSEDGVSFQRNSVPIIPDRIDENECQALPTVIHYKNRYHMIFCYRHAIGFRNDPSRSYRLGYAISNDLVNWERRDSDLILLQQDADNWDAEMMCYPNLFESDGRIYLLYNGNQFGKYGFGAAVLEN
ncbi:MAG: hypothetical protein N2044_09985 [Cyclobacteriaceae bacterium]|nr:hypothetical protein [Cyclobacteriaceae bacterium]